MSDFYVGQFIEETRKALYFQVELCGSNSPCLGRLAGIALIPVNAVALVANVLAAVIDTILQIWYSFSRDCLDGLITLGVMPIALAIQIPASLLEGIANIVYDIFAPLSIGAEKWAYRRYFYHNSVIDAFNGGVLNGWWANIDGSSQLFHPVAGER